MHITANSRFGRLGGRPQSAWRPFISILVAAAVLFSSLHHLLCSTDTEVFGSASSIVLASNDQAPPVQGRAGLPADCHCICHSTAEVRIDLASVPVEFADATYGMRKEPLPPAAAELRPFKPPRA